MSNIPSSMQYMTDSEIGSDMPDTEALWTKIAGSVNWLVDNVNVGVNKVISAICTTFSTTATSYTDITNLTLSITTTGRPVMLMLQSSSGAANTRSNLEYPVSGIGTGGAYLAVNRGGSNILEYWLQGDTASNNISGLGGIFLGMDFPAAGTYTYKLRTCADAALGGGVGISVKNMVLVAYEMRAL